MIENELAAWRQLMDEELNGLITLNDTYRLIADTNDAMREIFNDCTPSDITFIDDLWALIKPGTHRDDFILVRSPEPKVIGMAKISFFDRENGVDCEISYFGVRKEFRNQGVGGKIFQEIKRFAKASGATRLVADTAHQPVEIEHGELIFYGSHRFKALKSLGQSGSTRVGLIL